MVLPVQQWPDASVVVLVVVMVVVVVTREVAASCAVGVWVV